MAKAADVKAPNLLSDSFDADDEGWLDKLIADEEEPERATLWRLGSWAIAAVVALTLGLMSGQLPDGAKRADVAEAEIATQAQQLAGLARDTKQETRRIAAALETLNSDRDRLFNRITTVEQNLDSVTGSIAKQTTAIKPVEPMPDKPAERTISAAVSDAVPSQPAAAAATPEAKPEAKQETKKDSAKDTPKVASPQTAAIQIAPVQTAAVQAAPQPDTSKKADKKADRSDAQRAAAPAAPAESETAAATAAPPTQAAVAQDSPAQGADAASTTTVAKQAQSQQAAAPAAPMVITAAPLTPLPDEEVAAAEPEAPVDRTQFGLDLGGASSMTGLRALWSSIRKAHPSQFAALRPVLAIRPGKNGLGLQVHVVAGPIPDAAAAARLCAMLSTDERNCETVLFDGQRLLPDLDDAKKKPPAPARPARRKQARHEPAPATPAPPPAAGAKTSVLSLLGVR